MLKNSTEVFHSEADQEYKLFSKKQKNFNRSAFACMHPQRRVTNGKRTQHYTRWSSISCGEFFDAIKTVLQFD